MQSIELVVETLRSAQRVLFITGAGISADSGLPTYRGIGGLYEQAAIDDALPIEVLLSKDMLLAEPQRVWQHLGQIERACRSAAYNVAHQAIADFERWFNVVVLTQNIDGFHLDAGSSCVVEMHGNFHHLLCMRCGKQTQVQDYSTIQLPPLCDCGGAVRPEVVLFGEMLPDAALHAWYQQQEQGFDAVFSVGTTSLFPYIAEPVITAAQAGLLTVEINPAATAVSDVVQFCMANRSVDVLPALVELLNKA